METTPATTVTYNRAHSHLTDETVGYDVIRTIEVDGTILTTDRQARIEGRWDNTGRMGHYGEALEQARAIRLDGNGWAVVSPRYACGCHDGYFHGLPRADAAVG